MLDLPGIAVSIDEIPHVPIAGALEAHGWRFGERIDAERLPLPLESIVYVAVQQCCAKVNGH